MSKIRYHRKKSEGSHLGLPEFLPGMRGSADWDVQKIAMGQTPHTLNLMGGHGTMRLPDADRKDHRLVQLHELLHAAHSPVVPPAPIPRKGDKPDIDVLAVIIAEEIRINTKIRFAMGYEWAGSQVDTQPIIDTVNYHVFNPTEDTLQTLMMLHLCLWPWWDGRLSSGVSLVNATLYDIADDLRFNEDIPLDKRRDLQTFITKTTEALTQVAQYIYANVVDYSKSTFKVAMPGWKGFTIPVAAIIDNFLRNMDAFQPKMQDVPAFDDDFAGLMQRIMKSESDYEKRREVLDTGHQKPRDTHTGMTPEWGVLEIEEPRRTVKLPGENRRKSKYTAADYGAVPRYIHRSLVDDQIFARKKKIPSGSVLIDTSGSMRYSSADVLRAMTAAPAVIIGAYGGQGDHGTLRIVAKDGMRVNDKQLNPPGGGNDVDYPSLEWLAKQPEPRIWVTDGGVVPGRGGDQKLAAKQCMEFCVKHKINVVPTAAAAADVFEGKRALYR